MKKFSQVLPALTTAIAVSLAPVLPATATSFYSITDLGTLGGEWSQVSGINDAGFAVGVSQTADGVSHNFLWNSSAGIKDLNNLVSPSIISTIPWQDFFHQYALSGGPWFSNPNLYYPAIYPNSISQMMPMRVSNSGDVLGMWKVGDGFNLQEIGMFVLNAAGDVYNLGSFGGRFQLGYNHRKYTGEWVFQLPPRVTCFNNPYPGYPVNEGYEFINSCVSPSGMEEFVTFGANLSPVYYNSFGTNNNFYMNDAGEVFGYRRTANKENMAFLWNEGNGMIDLGIYSNSNDWINPNDLGTLGTDWLNSVYNTVAPNNVRVGSDWQNGGAVIWENEMMTNLNTLIPSNSGWFLSDATGINKSGQIVGNGIINGQRRAFLLTPVSPVCSVPEPSLTMSFLAFGVLGVGVLGKVKKQ